MAHHKFSDLRDHLFEQLENLRAEKVTKEDIDKAKTSALIADKLIEMGKLEFEYIKEVGKVHAPVILGEFSEVKKIV